MANAIRKTIASYDKIAKRYCRHTMRRDIRNIEEVFVSRFLDFIRDAKPLVADIGCGDGRDAICMVKRGARVLLVDFSKNMLAEARKKVPDGIHLLMDVRDLRLPSNYLDGVWASGVLYHLPKRELPQAIGEIYRVLKRRGIFALNFKVGKGEGMNENPRSYPGFPRYFAYYTLKEIMKHLSKFNLLEKDKYPKKIFGDRILQLILRKS